MATRASTHVTAFGLGQPVPVDGLSLEVWRCQGGTVGDTNTITPQRGRFVVAAVGGPLASTTIGANGTDTQVIFTQQQSSASTSVNYDAWIYVAP